MHAGCFAVFSKFAKLAVHPQILPKPIQRRITVGIFYRHFAAMPPKRKAAKAATKAEPKAKKAKVVKSSDGGAAEKKKPKVARDPIPDITGDDYSSDSKTKDGKPWNMKFSSWNVNGIRAWCQKQGYSYITAEDPDVFCVQETKCDKEKIPDEVNIEGYNTYWLSGDKEGYSGTGLYCKEKPINVTYGINVEEHDKEGRVITAEFDKFYFVTAYIPNSGRGLPRLKYRTEEWDPDFRQYLKDLDAKKPVIMCGDLNVAHLDIDLANPKSNKNKTAGFTDAEREEFGKLLDEGFIDSFRELYPEETGKYSYWTFMGNARAKNVGWRLDYFVISKSLKDKLCDNVMRTKVMGSDHCPITLFMAM